jgi:hypothetical protein
MRYNTFLGKRMAQTKGAIGLWEKVTFSSKVCRILEIGTFHGNFSLYLMLYCMSCKADFFTYDIVNWRVFDHRPNIKNILNFDKCFKQWDVFEHELEIGDIIKRKGVTILFCDGGNKEKEFNTFSKHLKTKDLIAIHDWKSKEVDPKNLDLTGFKEIFSKECDEEGMTRFFEKL